MAEFVADHGEEFVVVHQVHQAGVDAYGAVAIGAGVHLFIIIHLEVERLAVHGVHPVHHLEQALLVDGAGRRGLGIGIGDALAAELVDLFVGHGGSRDGRAGGVGQVAVVPVQAGQNGAAAGHDDCEQQGKKTLDHKLQMIDNYKDRQFAEKIVYSHRKHDDRYAKRQTVLVITTRTASFHSAFLLITHD